jgi:hypothetical protein
MQPLPIYDALRHLESVSLDDAIKDAVVTWSVGFDRTREDIAGRLTWAATCATNGNALPLDAEGLEEAYLFDATRPTVVETLTAMLTPHESEAA